MVEMPKLGGGGKGASSQQRLITDSNNSRNSIQKKSFKVKQQSKGDPYRYSVRSTKRIATWTTRSISNLAAIIAPKDDKV